MRIAVIAMVKNEADIIESFIRYNSAFADFFAICDNGSTDGTVSILRNLMREGIAIDLSEDASPGYFQSSIMTGLLRKVVGDGKADWILPLDADEFLVAEAGGNPRSVLQALSSEYVHCAKWKTYVPHVTDNEGQLFVPKRLIHYRREEPSDIRKVMIPRLLALQDGIRLVQGSHGIVGTDPIKHVDCSRLRVAHYPIRSVDQAVSKFSIGWLNYVLMNERKQEDGWHWKDEYEAARNYPDLGRNDAIQLALRYAAGKQETSGDVVRDPVDCSFLPSAEIKFASATRTRAFTNVIGFAESLASEVGGLRQKVQDLNEELRAAKAGFGQHPVLEIYRNMITFPRFAPWDSAWTEHLPFAFTLISLLRPGTLVELGVHMGNSFLAFCQRVQEEGLPTTCYGVDTWQGDEHTGAYAEEVFKNLERAVKDNHYDRFTHLLRMYFDDAAAYFSDRSIDLIHIDGSHTYEAVKHDFETWLPKASKRGVMLFHDVEVRERDFGVWKLWEEISPRFPSFKFRHGFGLGVLVVGDEVPEGVKWLITELRENPALAKRFEMYGKQIGRLSLADHQEKEIEELRDCFRIMGGRYGLTFANTIRNWPWLFNPLRRGVHLVRSMRRPAK